MKVRTKANELELNLTPASNEELQVIAGGSIDLDGPQCGNVIPHFPYPGYTSLGSVVIIPAAQNTWAGH